MNSGKSPPAIWLVDGEKGNVLFGQRFAAPPGNQASFPSLGRSHHRPRRATIDTRERQPRGGPARTVSMTSAVRNAQPDQVDHAALDALCAALRGEDLRIS